MAWTTPDTRSAGDVLSAANYNTYLRDNLNYLFSGRPKFAILRDNGASYTTTSLTFLDVDGTNLKGTLTVSGTAVLLGFNCAMVGLNIRGYFDFAVDGTRLGAAGLNGIIRQTEGNGGGDGGVSLIALVTGLSLGAHTFTIQWRAHTAGTLTMYAGNGTAGQDFIPHFWGIEVA